MSEPILSERQAIDPLQRGQTVLVRGIGHSMEPILKSGQVVRVEPIPTSEMPKKGDIVIAKVRGSVYLHKVTGVKNEMVQIGNNRGHINGWTPRYRVYGRLKKHEEPPAASAVGAKPSPAPPSLDARAKRES